MPEDSPQVAVDSHPRLSGIIDTINATRGHGNATRLPPEFYDAKLLGIIDKIAVEEWFSGYLENQEYRMLGIGSLVGDVVSRMVGSARQIGEASAHGISKNSEPNGPGKNEETNIKFAISGCHDTTIAGFLTGFGAFKREGWPPFTSHIAVELFQQRMDDPGASRNAGKEPSRGVSAPQMQSRPMEWLRSIFGSSAGMAPPARSLPKAAARKPLATMSADERKSLDGYFVRLRYNDRPLVVPGCRLPGNHLPGDETFCTLVSPR